MRWILLRGWTREARHWGAFPDALRAALPGAEVAALDLPGNGLRNEEHSPSTVHGMLEAVRGTAAGPAYLLGLSLGGMVAIEWAVRHPHEVAGCVLVNTSLRRFSFFYERLRPASYPAVARAFLEPDAARREAGVLALTTARGDGARAAAWASFAAERPVSRANALRQLVAAARYRAPESPPAAPMLVLCSRGDRLADPRCSRRLAERWRLPVAEHPTAGHDLPSDDGEWVAGEIARWLRALH